MNNPPLVILAGGKGTRLHPVTNDEIPKCMVDVYGKPFLYWLIKHYISQGFKDITVSTGYQAESIETYPWPFHLTYLRDAEDWSHEYFYESPVSPQIVVNGDTFIPAPLPTETRWPWVLSCNDIDAGAQYAAQGKIRIYKTDSFYDIGTPYGLEVFREYFKTHPLYIAEQAARKQ